MIATLMTDFCTLAVMLKCHREGLPRLGWVCFQFHSQNTLFLGMKLEGNWKETRIKPKGDYNKTRYGYGMGMV
jgi:hypothetical protein